MYAARTTPPLTNASPYTVTLSFERYRSTTIAPKEVMRISRAAMTTTDFLIISFS
jgi:hypothetical protein